VANLVALRRTGELPLQLDKALESGVSREELFEAIARGLFSRRTLSEPADGAPDSP
jgi:alkylhydroperoxidase/carboxymuconolactone decarboxylase family protein YurZ